MRFLSLIFCFVSVTIFARQIEFKGKLLDAETKEPVVYANLSFLETSKGISSTETGDFSIYINRNLLEKKVHISSLNYKDTIVLAKNLLNTTLYLQQKTEVLDEIILTKRLEREVVLDPIKRGIQKVHTKGLRMIAKYFPSTKKNSCCKYVSKVEIQFPKRQKQQSKFRFRIFNRDQVSGYPKDDLLMENIPITIKEGETTVFLDLEKYAIEMPENGLFIAFEKLFIPFNEYGKKENDPESEVYYSPVLGYTKSREYRRFERNYIFSQGKWMDLSSLNKGPMRGYVPAISVTLTN